MNINTIENIHIEQFPDGTSPNGSRLTIRQSGDHLTQHPESQSSIAFILTSTMIRLLMDGTVFKKANEMFGTDLSGHVEVKGE